MGEVLLNEQECSFVLENAKADVNVLRLKRCPARLANAIEARSRIERKLPMWFAHPELLYPSMLSVQQCSSQATASYKRQVLQRILGSGVSCGADLTGGMGVDSLFLSSLCNSFLYVERNNELYESVCENFKVLFPSFVNGSVLNECVVSNASTQLSFSSEVTSSSVPPTISMELCNREIAAENLDEVLGNRHYDFIFADPARRSASDSSRKLVALSEYTPDILAMKDALLGRCRYLLVKVSPMADITQVLRELPETIQIHVVSVDNDCKELLLLLKGRTRISKNGQSIRQETEIRELDTEVELVAVNINTSLHGSGNANTAYREKPNDIQIFKFAFGEKSDVDYADPQQLLECKYKFLYEPGKSILKAGAASLQATRHGLLQLAPASNLFVGNSAAPVASNAGGDNMQIAGDGDSDETCHRCRRMSYCSGSGNFQGRVYEVLEVVTFSKKALKEVCGRYPNAGMTSRNFPMSTNELVAATRTKESAQEHLFFTTLSNGGKVIIAAKIIP